MQIHATPTTDRTGIALDVDHPHNLQILDAAFVKSTPVVLTLDEAADLHAELGRAINDARRKADPYHGKMLTVAVRDDATVAEVKRWRRKIDDDFGHPIYYFALYVLEDLGLGTQVTNSNIAAILAWGEANPGHPFTFTITDEPDRSGESPF